MLEIFYIDAFNLNSTSSAQIGPHGDVIFSDYMAGQDTWSQGPTLQNLLMGKRADSLEPVKQKCGILPNVDSAHKGYGWIGRQLPGTSS